MSDKHGYVNYTHGCRCSICRKAKADYMRARRAKANRVALAQTAGPSYPYIAPLKRHGTRYGYEEKGCRCPECSAARSDSDRRYTGGAL